MPLKPSHINLKSKGVVSVSKQHKAGPAVSGTESAVTVSP
jgi:hypothetical protein